MRRALLAALPLALGLVLAACWPLSAYALGPVVLPSLVVVFVVGVLMLSRPELGLAFVLAIAPFTNLRYGGALGIGKPIQLILPALVFGLFGYGLLIAPLRAAGAPRRLPGDDLLPISLLGFVAVGLVSALNAIDPASSIRKLFLLITAVALGFGVMQFCRQNCQLIVIVAGAVVGLLLASLQGLAQHFLGLSNSPGFVYQGHFVARIQGSFGHPNQYAAYLAFLIPLAVACVLSRSLPSTIRWLGATATFAAVPALAYSYSRGAILALVLGSLVWLAVLRPRLAAAAAALVAVLAVLLAPPALQERFSPHGAASEVPLRTDIWGAAIDIYSQHPLLGVGIGNFATAYKSLPSTLANASQRRLLNQSGLLIPPHAQNLYLNVLAEEGVVGLGVLVLFGFAAFRITYRGSRLSDPAGRAIAVALGAGLATIAIHSIIEVTLISELSLPLVALLAVVWTSLAVKRTDQPPRHGSVS